MAKPQPSKLMLWVRFPSPAPFKLIHSSSVVELSAVNRSVVGSSPTCGAIGPVVKRLRHRPFTAVTRVRVPSGSYKQKWNIASVFLYLYLESCPSWPKEHAWKVCRRHKRLEGSNPSLSVQYIFWAFMKHRNPWYNRVSVFLFMVSFYKKCHSHVKI